MNKVYHSCVSSLSLSSSKSKFRLQHVFDVLDIISNGSLVLKLVKKLRGTNIRGREGHLFCNLRVALPLPATGDILVGLDDGAHACPRIVVLALNSECDVPHKVLDDSIPSGEASGCSVWYLLRMRTKTSELRLFLGTEGSTY